jgi:hypothetical protein
LAILAFAVVAGSAACGSTPNPSPAASLAATPQLDRTTAQAVEFRTSFSLRADLEFIAAVAADPRAVLDLGVPLLPDEVAELKRRAAQAEKITPIVQGYAAGFRDEFGGLYVDQANQGVVTVLWTDHLEQHDLALRQKLIGVGVVILREVRYSQPMLRSLRDRIDADRDWFATIRAALKTVEVDIAANAARIDVSTTNTAVAPLIVDHYGVESSMIAIGSDGTGALVQPWGSLRGRIVGVSVSILRQTTIQAELKSGDQGVRCEPGGDMGIGPMADGTFTVPCQPGEWVVRAIGEEGQIVAEGTVDMPAGASADVLLQPVAP